MHTTISHSTTDLLNQHQYFWDQAQNTKHLDTIETNLLKAAALGHYRAIASCSPKDQKILIEIAKINIQYQDSILQLKQYQKNDQAEAVREQIQEKLIKLLSYIDANNKLPSLKEIHQILSPPHKTKSFESLPHMKTVFSFLSFLLYGVNNYFSQSPKVREKFAETLNQAEAGTLIGALDLNKIAKSYPDGNLKETIQNTVFKFEEHRTRHKDGHILEMMCVKRNRKPVNSQKNIVMYFGGRSDNYAYSYKDVISKFASLPDCDEFWYINNRQVSLSSPTVHSTHQELVSDAETAHEYIESIIGGNNANITTMAMCAGSPAACEFAQKKGLKFFSDRSFIDVDNVVTAATGSIYKDIPVLSTIIDALLVPIRFLRRLYLKFRGFGTNQGDIYSEIPKQLRDLHSVMPPKSDKTAKHDGMTKGSNASLHRHAKLLEENNNFDQLFKAIVNKLSPQEQDDQGLSKKDALQRLTESRHHSVLTRILNFHKDRKSYIPSNDKNGKRDPHTAFAPLLKSRATNKNPLYRLNFLVQATNDDLLEDLSATLKSQDLAQLLEHVKPLAVAPEMRESIAALDSNLSRD